MPGREYSTPDYRYGFNGKEKDDETKGIIGSTIDFGSRIYDSRLTRWLSVDPLQKKYPDLSTYNFCASNPILYYDSDGRLIVINYKDAAGNLKPFNYTPGMVLAQDAPDFVKQVDLAITTVMKNDDTRTFQGISESSRTWTLNESASLDPNDNGVTTPSSNTGITGGLNSSTTWNPTAAGAAVDNNNIPTGEAMTPATILFHEAVHTKRIVSIETQAAAEAFKNDLKTIPDDPYHNAEEKRTVGIERNYINRANQAALNAPFAGTVNTIEPQQQGLRYNHTGAFFQTDGVNSINPTKNGLVEVQMENGKIGAYIRGTGTAGTTGPDMQSPSPSTGAAVKPYKDKKDE